jgi:hypothetical protein
MRPSLRRRATQRKQPRRGAPAVARDRRRVSTTSTAPPPNRGGVPRPCGAERAPAAGKGRYSSSRVANACGRAAMTLALRRRLRAWRRRPQPGEGSNGRRAAKRRPCRMEGGSEGVAATSKRSCVRAGHQVRLHAGLVASKGDASGCTALPQSACVLARRRSASVQYSRKTKRQSVGDTSMAWRGNSSKSWRPVSSI